MIYMAQEAIQRTSNEAVNTFKDGLIMDFHPLNAGSATYVNALNATLLTRNGNEYIMQNDMGNGRVETAYLPEGYIPLGTTSFGGIIYIVSYNPLTDRCQIGSFPSPERNVTSDELGETEKCLDTSVFYDNDNSIATANAPTLLKLAVDNSLASIAIKMSDTIVYGDTVKYKATDGNDYSVRTESIDLIKNNETVGSTDSTTYLTDFLIKSPSTKLLLTDTELNPGDKFIIFNNGSGALVSGSDYISGCTLDLDVADPDLYPKYLKLNVVAIQDNGEITNINDAMTWYDYGTNNYGYYIYPEEITLSDNGLSIDEYRNLVSSNYTVFQSKVSGKLAILAELEAIDTFDVSWDAIKINNKWNFFFYTGWTYENDNLTAKNKINLYGIFCEEDVLDDSGAYNLLLQSLIVIQDYPKSSDDDATNNALTNLETIFYTPKYINSLEEAGITTTSDNTISAYSLENNGTVARTNDGLDNQFLISLGVEIDETSGIIQMVVAPVMPFGILEYLSLTFTINLDKLGTGAIELKQYKYYWEDTVITLNWALEAYPERNKSINGVTFNFYDYSENILAFIKNFAAGEDSNNSSETKLSYEEGNYLDNFCAIVSKDDLTKYGWVQNGEVNSDVASNIINSEEETTDDSEEETTVYTLVKPYYTNDSTNNEESVYSREISNKSSYSGNFSETLKQATVGLENGHLYMVEIIVNYNDEYDVVFYRFMYTSNVFNNYYNKVDDYAEIVLEDALVDDNAISITADNIKQNISSESLIVDRQEWDFDDSEISERTDTTITSGDDNALTISYNTSDEDDNEKEYSYTESEIPYYKETDDTSFDLDVVKQVRYLNNSATFDIVAENNIFDVVINAIGKEVTRTVSGDNVSYSVTNTKTSDVSVDIDLGDAESTTMVSKSSYSSNTEVDNDAYYTINDISLDSDTLSGSIGFSLVIDNQIHVDYDETGYLDVDGLLTPITVGRGFLAAYIANNWGNLYFNENIDDASETDNYGDDEACQLLKKLSSYTTTYSQIQDKLNDYDVLEVQCALRYYKKDNPKHLIISTNSSESVYWKLGTDGNSNSSKRGYSDSFIGFAIKNDVDAPYVIAVPADTNLYNSNDKLEAGSGTWYNKELIDYYQTKGSVSSYQLPLAIDFNLDWGNYGDDYNPFANYYKLENYDGSGKEVNMYSVLVYWETYTWYLNFSIDFQAAITLRVNNCDIPASEGSYIDGDFISDYTMPNNLSYYWLFDSDTKSSPLTGKIADSIQFSDVVEMVEKFTTKFIYNTSTEAYIEVEDSLLLTKLYNENAEEIIYLKRFQGSVDADKQLLIDHPSDNKYAYDLKIYYNKDNGGVYFKEDSFTDYYLSYYKLELYIKITNLKMLEKL